MIEARDRAMVTVLPLSPWRVHVIVVLGEAGAAATVRCHLDAACTLSKERERRAAILLTLGLWSKSLTDALYGRHHLVMRIVIQWKEV